MSEGTSATINKIKASGRLVAAREREDGSTVITLFVNLTNKEIYPKFTCPPGTLPPLEKHDRITITGHIHTFVHHKKGAKSNFRQEFIADSVKKERTLTEISFGLKGSFYPAMYCNAFVKGTIKSFKEDGGWERYVVATTEPDGKSAEVMLNQKKQEIISAPFEKGSVICAVCGIVTVRKTVHDREVFYENITISDAVNLSAEAE